MSLLRRRKPLSAAHKKAISDALKGKKRGGGGGFKATPDKKSPGARLNAELREYRMATTGPDARDHETKVFVARQIAEKASKKPRNHNEREYGLALAEDGPSKELDMLAVQIADERASRLDKTDTKRAATAAAKKAPAKKAAPAASSADVDSVVKSKDYQAIAGKVYSRYTALADAHKRNSGGQTWAQAKANDPGLKRLGAQAQKLLPEGYTFDPKWPETPKKTKSARARK